MDQYFPQTTTYLGIRLTVQCDDPNDPFYHPQDFYPVQKEGGVYIGRSAGNDVQLYHSGVSSVHCRVEMVQGEFQLEDAGSSNGTFVGYRRLAPGERYTLRDGDVIGVLGYSITFRLGLSAFGPNDTQAVDLESTYQVGHAMVQQFLNEPEEHSPQIRVVNGALTGQIFTLQQYEDGLIGREPSCTICLPEDAVSRRHAMLRRDWSGVTIRDLNSSNGVYVNGIRILANTEVELHDGDQIGIGHCMLSFHDPFAASLEAKLQGVWLDEKDDNTLNGVTLIGTAAGATGPRAPTDNDVREPQSGRWRSPGRPAAAQKPKQPPTPKPASPTGPEAGRKVQPEPESSQAAQVASQHEPETPQEEEDPRERRRRRRRERRRKDRTADSPASSESAAAAEPAAQSGQGEPAEQDSQQRSRRRAEPEERDAAPSASTEAKPARGAEESSQKKPASRTKDQPKQRVDETEKSQEQSVVKDIEVPGVKEVRLGRWERFGLITAIVLIFILVVLVLVLIFLV